MGKKAIVIGATGLVGCELIDLLLNHSNFEKVIAFVRRPVTHINHPKFEQHVINFAMPEDWRNLVKGDVLFSALGTTLKQAKNKTNQYQIDFMHQYNFAEIAANNNVGEYVLVSSMGANSKSMFFYMRMKGELENAVAHLPFQKIVIIRPSQLEGRRHKKRTGEKMALLFTKAMNKIGLLRNSRPIHAQTVAKAMINALETTDRHSIHSQNKLFELAKQ